jgi:hypothetical protein
MFSPQSKIDDRVERRGRSNLISLLMMVDDVYDA